MGVAMRSTELLGKRMMRRVRLALAALFLAALGSCGGGGGGQQLVQLTPATAGTTFTSTINSAQTGMPYAVDIWLPPGYAEGMANYPVVYATDCEYRWTTLLQDVQQFAARGGAKVILVNICAGSSDRRWVDFTMPGAAPYFRFLTLELIPSIDASYRTDPSNRTLSGHSLSGEFALCALYMEDPAHRYFTSIVSEECSCWYDASQNWSQGLAQPIAMELAMYGADRNLPINLVMAGDTTSNERYVQVVYSAIASQQFQNLRLTQPTYGLGHVPMDGPAFADALSFIFPGH